MMSGMDELNIEAVKVIDFLGGTTAAANLCDIKPPSVSEWKKYGIPKTQARYIRVVRPDAFHGVDYESCLSSRAA